MAQLKFYSDINLQKNALVAAVAENLSTAPSSPADGQFYYDTDDNAILFYNGSAWESMAGDIKSIADAGNSRVTVTNGSGGAVTLDINIANLIDDGSSTSSNIYSASKVDSLITASAQGLDVKESVRFRTTANVDLSSALVNGAAFDGVTAATGDRALVMSQTDASENGIYIVAASGAASRAADMPAADEVANAFMFIEEGTTWADTQFVCTNNSGSDVVGTDDLVFAQFGGASGIVAGDGLAKTANTLSVNVDDTGIEISTDTLQLKDGGVVAAKIGSQAVTEAKLHTSVAGDGLAGGNGTALSVNVDDSSIEINTDALRVKAAGITNAMLAGSIADSKLNQLTTANKVAGSAVQLATNGGLEDSTGLKVKVDATGGANLAEVINLSSNGVAVKVDDATIEANGSGQLAIVAGGVDTTQLAADAVDGTKIADDAIDSEHVAAGALDTEHYADNSVTLAKLGSGAAAMYSADFVSGDFSGEDLTIAAATHGLGATKALQVLVYEDGTPNVHVMVPVTVADNGDVVVSANTAFDGHIVISGKQ